MYVNVTIMTTMNIKHTIKLILNKFEIYSFPLNLNKCTCFVSKYWCQFYQTLYYIMMIDAVL